MMWLRVWAKKTIAEYVENAESLEILRNMGVDYAQGYYIGKPLPDLLDNERVFPDVQHATAPKGVLSPVSP